MLRLSGYSIFIIVGDLLECEADQLLRLCPAVQPIKPELITDKRKHTQPEEDGDEEVKKAVEQSKKFDSDDASFQRALQLSMEGRITS